jgi:23S rRNA (pseudouridine1915-N3)-methyltransferase
MRMVVLAQGKKLDAHTAALCDEYVKRCGPLVPVERHVCTTAKQQWERAAALRGPKVVLDERGLQLTTTELAARVDAWRSGAVREVGFLVGGADGFGDEERQRADLVLALSRLTMPHRLAQLILCEQLYRVGTVLAGHPYHHA